jgi:formamidopyrimidine-DNA glycosylase
MPINAPGLKFNIFSVRFTDGEGFALTDFQKTAVLTLNPVTSKVPDAVSLSAANITGALKKWYRSKPC